MDGTGGPSRRRAEEAAAEEDDDDDEEGGVSLRAELLLYSNIKLAAVVTRMMPPTPWHWKIDIQQGRGEKVQTGHKKQHGASDGDNCAAAANWMQQNFQEMLRLPARDEITSKELNKLSSTNKGKKIAACSIFVPG